MRAENLIRWLVAIIGLLLALVFWKLYPDYAVGWAAFFIAASLFIGDRIARINNRN